MQRSKYSGGLASAAALFGLLLGGCGGSGVNGDADSATPAQADAAPAPAPAPTSGGGPTPGPAPSPAPSPAASPPPVAAPPAYAVAPDELLTNGQFSSGATHWAIADASLSTSELRKGGKALDVGGQATQSFSVGKLRPGRSYTLVVKARNAKGSAAGQLAMRFRRPAGNEVFRSYEARVVSTTYREHRIEFTAPAYASMAEFNVKAGGARVIVDSVSLKMRAPIARTEPVASQVGSHVPPGYVLAFNDEFDGDELDRSKWFTRYINAGGTLDRLKDEQQRYRDNDNHRVEGGVLSLVARRTSRNDPKGIDYESGMIRSDWATHYGYFEARVKMPKGKGVFPAFWLISDVSSTGAQSWPPEIDIFEFVNNGVEDRNDMLHSNVIVPEGQSAPLLYADPAYDTTWAYYRAPFKFDEGWHTVGAEWTPGTVTVYVDGRKIHSRGYPWVFPDGTPAGPAHILLNFAVGGGWAGRHGIDHAAFPQALQVNWVRAYRKAG